MEYIEIEGARVHNLKNIDVRIPRNALTVITGISGSGKSSLAFDTIFAEGQRRYIETFSAYAKNFLGNFERPDVDKISGLSPVISIEQKTTNRNPRSTVGTTTEIYDFLRLLYARAGVAYSYETGEKMIRYTEEKAIEMILSDYASDDGDGRPILLLAPVVRGRKGHYRELFETLMRKGYLYARVDGEIKELTKGMRLDRYKNHNVEVVVDKLKAREKDTVRLKTSVATAMKLGEGVIMVIDNETGESRYYSRNLMCPTTGISYDDPAPNNFSFNSPQGACEYCKGLGYVNDVDMAKIIPDKGKSIRDGGIIPLGSFKKQLIFFQIEEILQQYGCELSTPISEIPQDALTEIMYGSLGESHYIPFEGIMKYLRSVFETDDSAMGKRWAEQFMQTCKCPVCGGQRLNRIALSYKLWDKNIAELAEMDISDFQEWIEELPEHLDKQQNAIAAEIIKEIRTRIGFLMEVGLDYLSLNRQSGELSGGESQRIRLATQIGSQLVNVLYILDEPSIGLHQRDNEKLIKSLKELRDIGNTVIVVEHDKDMMLNADYLIDIGPGAGRHGGEVCYQGARGKVQGAGSKEHGASSREQEESKTLDYLSGKERIEIPKKRREGNGKSLILKGCRGNNLKNIDVEFPLGKLILVTGVSGSGKSSLVNGTLYPILSKHFYRSLRRPLEYDQIEGIENIDKVICVDQSPIGRTPRSNPATYTGVFSDIRNLFVGLPEAKIRGYKPGRFSFNVSGGRCDECNGNGYKVIEMKFLPDVMVPCEVCHGKRYNRETLEVKYKGKSIADVLDMTIDQAVEFFENIPTIVQKIRTLRDVGLGYITLGQSSTSLSGGESQRVKLAAELSKRDTGKTLYILDEPTTGLHFDDIKVLMDVLAKLVDKGNTVVVIEHNMDVIKQADHIIDMGPEGGRGGGMVVASGTPEELVKKKMKAGKRSYTAEFLGKELNSRTS